MIQVCMRCVFLLLSSSGLTSLDKFGSFGLATDVLVLISSLYKAVFSFTFQ